MRGVYREINDEARNINFTKGRFKMKREELIAEVCYEANRLYSESTGDFGQKKWDALTELQRGLIVNTVDAIIENPDLSPEVIRDSWSESNSQDGWEWGAVQNSESLKHTYSVPHSKSQENLIMRDVLFTAIARAMDEEGDGYDFSRSPRPIFFKTYKLLRELSQEYIASDYLADFRRDRDSATITCIAVGAYERVVKKDDIEIQRVSISLTEYKDLRMAKLYCQAQADCVQGELSAFRDEINRRYQELCREDGLLSGER